MNSSTTFLRIAAAGFFAAMLSGCDLTGPAKGGRQDNPNRCGAKGYDNVASESGISLVVTAPSCAFSAQYPYSYISYAATVYEPTASADPRWPPTARVEVMSAYTWAIFGSLNTGFMTRDFPDTTRFKGVVSQQLQPGYYPNPAAGHEAEMVDSMVAYVDVNPNRWPGGQAKSWYVVTGTVSSAPHDLLGPTSVRPTLTANWRMRTDWDTTQYTFQWLVDGTQPPNAVGAQFSTAFNVLGDHTLTSISIRTDNSADTVRRLINVPFTVDVNGPSSMDPNGPGGVWNAAIPVGVAPYTYSWSIDGTPIGITDASYGGTVGPPGIHRLSVYVTDAAGHSGEGYIDVQVTAGCPDPTMLVCE